MSDGTPASTVGGPVPLDGSCYIARPFERELFEAVTSSNWAVLLGPRQHGKTSALTRLYVNLNESGIKTAMVDFQAYGGEESYERFLVWVSGRIAQDLGIDPIDSASSEDVELMMRGTLPEELANVALIFDEISAVPAGFQQRFFGQLRAFFNLRGRKDKNDLTWRVNLVFAGTFRPESMIEGDNSPFNISKFVYAEDFTEEQVDELVGCLGGEVVGDIGKLISAQVGGQPYLVQLYLSAAERLKVAGASDLISPTSERLLGGADRHLANLVTRVRSDEALSGLLPSILEGTKSFRGTDDDDKFAVTIGLAEEVDGRLVVRNALYQSAFQDLATESAALGEAPSDCDVLLVTANEIETTATREVFAAGGSPFSRSGNQYVDLGVHGTSQVALVRCQTLGSTGAGSSQLVVRDAIADLSPSIVVVVGIAFGMDSDEQPIGTILVASRIVAYESSKVATDEDGATVTLPRGAQYDLDPKILGRLQEMAHIFEASAVQFGSLLSGEKLIDNLPFRDELLRIAPEAIGGEMEAAGACAAAARERLPCLVVKAVCDYADGEKAAEKNFRQARAADKAAEFVRAAIEDGAVDPLAADGA